MDHTLFIKYCRCIKKLKYDPQTEKGLEYPTCTSSVYTKRGFKRKNLQGTTQNDIIKEYLSRGTYIFPPKESMNLTSDIISFTYKELPKWNPINICSYHLQEVGATPEQEISYALSNACEVLNTVKKNGQVPKKDFPSLMRYSLIT